MRISMETTSRIHEYVLTKYFTSSRYIREGVGWEMPVEGGRRDGERRTHGNAAASSRLVTMPDTATIEIK